jgi:hypothetical protein
MFSLTSSAVTESLRNLWNPKIHYHTDKSSPLAFVLSQIFPIHILIPCCFCVFCNVVLILCWFTARLLSRFQNKCVCIYITSSLHAVCLSYLILNFMTLITYGASKYFLFILRNLFPNSLIVGLFSLFETRQSYNHFFLYMALRPDWWSWLPLTGFTLIGLTTVSRTPVKKWSARPRDLYLTKHNTHKRQTSMPPEGFEPTIQANERPQTHPLDGAATGTGLITTQNTYNKEFCV